MKKLLAILLGVVLGCFAFVGCTEPLDYEKSYTITYKEVINGVEDEIPYAMYKADGTYPKSYTAGSTVDVDELKDVSISNEAYDFIGWYTDISCTTSFEGIKESDAEDKTIYAKIDKIVISYSITYRAVVNDVVVDIPEQMYIEDGSYPTSYNQGAGATISDLQNVTILDETYTFIGWYLNEACTYALGSEIATDAMGNAVLYAKIIKGDYDPNPNPQPPDEPRMQTITYKAYLNGNIIDVPTGMFVQGGSYPTEWTEGDVLTISRLKTNFYYNDGISIYKFVDWYLDETCTVALSTELTTLMEDITLYAKLIDGHKITYKAVVYTEIKDIPADMFDQNGSYPEVWFTGDVLSVGALKDFSRNGGYPVNEFQTWTFVAWYEDSACTVVFNGNLANLTGPKTLYAKMSVATWTPNY